MNRYASLRIRLRSSILSSSLEAKYRDGRLDSSYACLEELAFLVQRGKQTLETSYCTNVFHFKSPYRSKVKSGGWSERRDQPPVVKGENSRISLSQELERLPIFYFVDGQ